MSITWKYTKQRVDLYSVEEVEISLGVRFPKSFVECSITNNGGRPVPCAFDFEGRSGAVFQNLLRIEIGEKESIVSVMRALGDRLPSGCVPFAADPFGNFLCFKYPCQGEPPVVFWEHEKKTEDSVSLVCGSFSELLQRLHD